MSNKESQEDMCSRFEYTLKSLLKIDFKKRLKESKEIAEERSKKTRPSAESMVDRDEEDSKKPKKSTKSIVNSVDEGSKSPEKSTGIKGVLHEKVGLASVSNGKRPIQKVLWMMI